MYRMPALLSLVHSWFIAAESVRAKIARFNANNRKKQG